MKDLKKNWKVTLIAIMLLIEFLFLEKYQMLSWTQMKSIIKRLK